MNEKKDVEGIYCVFDTLTGRLSEFGTYPNDGIAARSILSTLRVPLKDTILLKLGVFDTSAVSPEMKEVSLSDVTFCFACPDPEVIPWTVYRFPETVSEAIAPLGVSPEEVKQIAESRLKSISDRVESNSSRSAFSNIINKVVNNGIQSL